MTTESGVLFRQVVFHNTEQTWLLILHQANRKVWLFFFSKIYLVSFNRLEYMYIYIERERISDLCWLTKLANQGLFPKLLCLGKIFCLQLKKGTFEIPQKYLAHTWKDMIFREHCNFESSYAFLNHLPPHQPYPPPPILRILPVEGDVFIDLHAPFGWMWLGISTQITQDFTHRLRLSCNT